MVVTTRLGCLMEESCMAGEGDEVGEQYLTSPHLSIQIDTVMSETEIWQSRQDRDFHNHNPFFETGIETLKKPIPFSRLGSRL